MSMACYEVEKQLMEAQQALILVEEQLMESHKINAKLLEQLFAAKTSARLLQQALDEQT